MGKIRYCYDPLEDCDLLTSWPPEYLYWVYFKLSHYLYVTQIFKNNVAYCGYFLLVRMCCSWSMVYWMWVLQCCYVQNKNAQNGHFTVSWFQQIKVLVFISKQIALHQGFTNQGTIRKLNSVLWIKISSTSQGSSTLLQKIRIKMLSCSDISN